MDLNSSSDEEEDTPVAAPPSSPPEQATIDQAGGATTSESMSVDEGNEQVPEVEVEAVWEEEEEEDAEPGPRHPGSAGPEDTGAWGPRRGPLGPRCALSPLALSCTPQACLSELHCTAPHTHAQAGRRGASRSARSRYN